MTIVEEDIFEVEELISSGWHCQYQVYKNTNEDLVNVLSVADFWDKDVLTVLGSSDQLFSAYYLGAKNVDTFDKNRIAYYYYFLRKWCFLKYRSVVIPSDTRNVLEAIYLHDDSEDEKTAYCFWKEILEYCIEKDYDFFYNRHLFAHPDQGWSVPYTCDDRMLKIIKSIKPNYKQQDLFKPFDCDKEYDIVILSNILEFMTEYKSKAVLSNLNKLVKDGGLVICSNVRHDNPEEITLFEDHGFIYDEGANGIITTRKTKQLQPVCYTYMKVS